ncbi:alpha/beta fold hydrolase [Ideonella sp. A 288]|uniref:alpha/beta fold hydrolase n=1 Tax=Ideonella sp. A 288 TaxID=1962181 RepID=UPI000B4A9716|nr:alpha/beta fold hydrolase [Ideonella sp. A 288]
MHPLLIVLIVLAAGVGGLWLFTFATARRVEAMLPPQGRFVDVPGARLHVVERGQGRPLLLIHGLAGQLCHFTYAVVDLLATRYRVIAVDRPGSGYSVRLPGASGALYAQADAMAALIDTLQLERPVVVGHSLGGALALALAQRHPGRVSALALVAPLTHTPKDLSPAFSGLAITRPWLRHLVAWTVALPATIAQRDTILGLVFGPEAVPSDFATRGGGLLGVRPSHFVAASTDLAAVMQDLPTIESRYPTMQLPVGVLYGRGDRVLDPTTQGQGLVDRLPGARLDLVDGGHMLPITAPARTAAFIVDIAERALHGSAGRSPS